MRKKMRDEILAQMEFNNQNMMSWDEKVRFPLPTTKDLDCEQ